MLFLFFLSSHSAVFLCKANNEQNRKKDKAALPRTVVFKGIDLVSKVARGLFSE